jgi:2-keto-4-pentenoate hydratase/2-oxohepta-3-ene-1,7-dioic acid hydratase in catechol pathway
LKLVTFGDPSGPRLGAMISGGRIVDLAKAGNALGHDIPASMQALIEAGQPALTLARESVASAPDDCILDEPRLLSPLPRPVRMRDAQLFLEHLEVVLKREKRPMSDEYYRQVIYYNADHIHVFGPEDEIGWPRASGWIDYELEWAVIIGKSGTNIPKERAKEHIFGYTIFNDWSARDLQFPFQDGGLGPGAGKDFATSLGPCIVTADDLPNPYALTMTADVNGERWSTGATASMHWTFEDAIAQLSADRSLEAGEIIASGTVLTGCGFDLQRRLALGDLVELEVEGIGILRNRVVASDSATPHVRGSQA